MFTVITIIHILLSIFLVLVVLLQTGKGADMGAVFGGSSSTVFGSSGAGNFLTKLTTATAVIFMITSLSLTYFSSQRNSATVFDSAPATAPVAPPAPDAAAPEAAAPEAAAPEPAMAPEPHAAAPQPAENAPAAKPAAGAPEPPAAEAPVEQPAGN